MPYTLDGDQLETLIFQSLYHRSYINQQSKIFIESKGKKGLPCKVKAQFGDKNIYEYDPSEIYNWLINKHEESKLKKKEWNDAEKILSKIVPALKEIMNA